MEIKFCKNWNNKLNNKYFTTIRYLTSSKYFYYQNNEGNIFDVILKGNKVSTARLVDVSQKDLADILTSGINYTDAALDADDFYEMMKRMYHNKDLWDDWETKMIVLIFKNKDKNYSSKSGMSEEYKREYKKVFNKEDR